MNRPPAILIAVTLLFTHAAQPARGGPPVDVPPAAGERAQAPPYSPQRVLAGHYLRRLGFGPTRADLDALENADLLAYLDQQLDPASIDDTAAEAKFHRGPANPNETEDFSANIAWIKRWYTRMVYSRRQLQEKMTLFWHELFSVSWSKANPAKMHDHEELLRRNCLGSFSRMLVDVTRDPAMLNWLDNNYNNGNAYDANGRRIPPNENYARELLQLFSIGPVRLNMDGTPVTGPDGVPQPNYTEDDVKAVARALTGWYSVWDRRDPAHFMPEWHDAQEKRILGERVAGRRGADGAREVEDVVAILMRHPSMPPFIAKQLIQKFATETPAPGHVERVATVFRDTEGDIKQTVRAVVTDAEFTSPAVVRSQYKLPIEAFVGMARALEGATAGASLVDAGWSSQYQIYAPPTVFSFYRPGEKKSLSNSSLLLRRDSYTNWLLHPHFDEDYKDLRFDLPALARQYELATPQKAVAFLSDVLLAAPLEKGVRKEVLAYMGGQVNDEKLRGAAWLIVASPEYLLN